MHYYYFRGYYAIPLVSLPTALPKVYHCYYFTITTYIVITVTITIVLP